MGYNDDGFAGSTDSFLEINVTIGQTYYIAVTTPGTRVSIPQNPFGRSSTTNDTGQYDLFLSFL